MCRDTSKDRALINWIIGYATASKDHGQMIDPDVVLLIVNEFRAIEPQDGA